MRHYLILLICSSRLASKGGIFPKKDNIFKTDKQMRLFLFDMDYADVKKVN